MPASLRTSVHVYIMYHWPSSIVINMNSLQMCCLLKGAGHAIYLLGKQKYCTNDGRMLCMHTSHTHTQIPLGISRPLQQDKWYLSHFIAHPPTVSMHPGSCMALFMYNALTNANSPCTMIIFSSKYHKSATATAK